MKKKIAVIGSGAAGMTAAFLLQRKFDVTLFEASDRLGGHAHSVAAHDSLGHDLELDVAFLMFNDRTYPSFGKFLTQLGIADRSIEMEMSACFSDPLHDMHFTLGRGLAPMFHQKRNLLRPRFWRIFKDLAAFRKRASADLASGHDLDKLTVGEYLAPYGEGLRENFVLPLASAIWSLDRADILNFPAGSILRYFDNHQLLHGNGEKCWRTINGSSGQYVRAFSNAFRGRVSLGDPVTRIERDSAGAVVHSRLGEERFDHVVLAGHADQSLQLLAKPTDAERRLLGAWKYHQSSVVLHKDTSVLHPSPELWASWNMRRQANGGYECSFWLNRAQSIASPDPFILTLGQPRIREELVLGRYSFSHPVISTGAVATQPLLSSLNEGRTSFCGSYFGSGFHEDAVASAVKVAQRFGIDWDTVHGADSHLEVG